MEGRINGVYASVNGSIKWHNNCLSGGLIDRELWLITRINLSTMYIYPRSVHEAGIGSNIYKDLEICRGKNQRQNCHTSIRYISTNEPQNKTVLT